MARPLRIGVANGWYHVTNRGLERREVFIDGKCYEHFVGLMVEVVERFNVRFHAYVPMPNHFHLVVRTPEANLSVAMQWLGTSYSMWFNRRENRVGPLFQGRFKAVLFDGGTESWVVTRYVHLNPVRVKGLDLCKEQSKAESRGLVAPSKEVLENRRKELREYRWSSYPAYAGWIDVPEWLDVKSVLSGGHECGLEKQRVAYREYVESTLGEVPPESPMERVAGGLLLGSAGWVEKMRRLLKGNRTEQKAFRRLETRPGWHEVRKAVEKVKGESWVRFAHRHGDWGRDLAFYLARRYSGVSLRSLAEESGTTSYLAVSQAVLRMNLRMKKDKQLQKIAEDVLKCMEA